MLGNFFKKKSRLLIFFFKFGIFKKFSEDYHLSVKLFGFKSGPTFWASNCLQRLSADNKCHPSDKSINEFGPQSCQEIISSFSENNLEKVFGT